MSALLFETLPVCLDARNYGVIGDGVADDTVALQSFFDYIATAAPYAVVIPPLSYRLTASVLADIPDDTTIFAYGARFNAEHDGLLFDVNPDATAALPVTTTEDTFTKRRVSWLGGIFSNTAGTKAASIAMQSFFMREFVFEPDLIQDFYTAVKFGAKDSYRFRKGYAFNCTRTFWVPDAGVLFTESLTGNDLIDVELAWHISCAGMEHAILIENRVVNLRLKGSVNGETTGSQVVLHDNATLYGRGYNFDGLHTEQCGGGHFVVEFVASGGNGFYGVDFDGGCDFSSGSVGWGGIKLNKCNGVKLGVNVFSNGSGGSSEVGVYVDSDSRNVNIDTDGNQFLGFASGQAIVLESASDRENVSLLPNVVRLAAPEMITGYNGATFSTSTATIDMSANLASFNNFLLPPKGYEVALTGRDSGSAAAGFDAVKWRIKKPSSNDNSGLTMWLAGVNDNNRRSLNGFVGADDNGDIYSSVTATGASTFTSWLAVNAVYQ